MKSPLLGILGLLLLLAGCAGVAPPPQSAETAKADQNPRILAMGDSMMAWHGTSRRSISHALAAELGEPVANRSVSGSYMIYALPITGSMGMKIARQYVPGDWEWIVLNGGGNDLWLGCGCNQCDARIEKMISADGSNGEIPRLVSQMQSSGAQVVYVGYLRSPGVGSIIEHCRDDGDELERRIALLAEREPRFHFVSLAQMVPHGDRSYHAADMIHPSIKASAAIGNRIARLIRSVTSRG